MRPVRSTKRGVSLDLRTATLDDEDAVLDLIEELFAPPGTRPPDYARERGVAGFRHAVENANADVLLAIEGETVVGLASVYAEFPTMRFGWRCWLEDMVVTSSRRGQSIGRALLDAATTWARGRGCVTLELSSATTRADAHRFYRSNGMSDKTSLIFGRRVDRR